MLGLPIFHRIVLHRYFFSDFLLQLVRCLLLVYMLKVVGMEGIGGIVLKGKYCKDN